VDTDAAWTYHVKGIGHQGERVHGKTGAQLNAEEDDVDDEHHLDARRLGPAHLGVVCGRGRRRTREAQGLNWRMCRGHGIIELEVLKKSAEQRALKWDIL